VDHGGAERTLSDNPRAASSAYLRVFDTLARDPYDGGLNLPFFGDKYYGSALLMARKRSMAFSLDDESSQHGPKR
jgi:hypothetical protein